MSLDLSYDLDVCQHCGRHAERVFDKNITYNLGPMWRAAGLPFSDESIEGKPARDMLEPMRDGLVALLAEPEKFRAMNPSNGWGSYEGLVRFVEAAIAAADEYPDAIVRASR